MADLIQPATLPSPSEWEQQANERRLMRSLREPANAARLRSRELLLRVSAAWVYSAVEMGVWVAWYEGALATQLARLRWFVAPLPGRGGVLSRAARYMEPPQREYLGAGIWRVSAPLQVRDVVGALPQQAATVPGAPESFELREDGSFELREDGSFELRG